jgi:glucose/arabinose dehydrogenase
MGVARAACSTSSASNQLIYWSYAEPRENGQNNTAVARGKFVDDAKALPPDTGELWEVEHGTRGDRNIQSAASASRARSAC